MRQDVKGATARAAVDFLNSCGINAHLDQGNETATELAAWLIYLGVRQYRYDPAAGTAPIQSLTGVSAVTIMLTDHPVIIEAG